MRRVKRIFTVALAVALILVSAYAYQTKQALNEYKRVYDGLLIYEDGSWDYADEEYFFWNWEKKYVGR